MITNNNLLLHSLMVLKSINVLNPIKNGSFCWNYNKLIKSLKSAFIRLIHVYFYYLPWKRKLKNLFIEIVEF